MMNERTKSIRILHELIGYYYKHKINDIQMQLCYTDNECKIMLEGTCCRPPEDLEKLSEALNSPRQIELEECYWQLLGDNSGEIQLSLLGSLVDSADIDFDLQKLSLTVYRKKQFHTVATF
ncbi:hypothetical protein SAMN05660297_03442 [Natronincola peptidivorans]|uniref:Uncharacterized protein n=1 Tax=Natronincola peptidivorans TaxID=426128 RepID=A0A1I0H077_9FIRM|nr:hypothetical protein [Natronincola peptidivorans]SET76950.1 hypothetical protein SAMN05660297_03442 [Natronincola peptidivorans]